MCRGDFAIGIDAQPCHRHACTWVELETARNVTKSSRARLSRTRARPSAARARAPHGRASHADPSSTCRADLATGIDVLPYHRHSCPWATLRTPQNVTNSSWARLGRARPGRLSSVLMCSCPWAKLRTAHNMTNLSLTRRAKPRARPLARECRSRAERGPEG